MSGLVSSLLFVVLVTAFHPSSLHSLQSLYLPANVCTDLTHAEEVLSKAGTFDVIHVGAAATEEMLPRLLSLLNPGGKMVVPVGPPLGLQVSSGHM